MNAFCSAFPTPRGHKPKIGVVRSNGTLDLSVFSHFFHLIFSTNCSWLHACHKLFRRMTRYCCQGCGISISSLGGCDATRCRHHSGAADASRSTFIRAAASRSGSHILSTSELPIHWLQRGAHQVQAGVWWRPPQQLQWTCLDDFFTGLPAPNSRYSGFSVCFVLRFYCFHCGRLGAHHMLFHFRHSWTNSSVAAVASTYIYAKTLQKTYGHLVTRQRSFVDPFQTLVTSI